MTPQKQIKIEAKGRLRGNWPSALGVWVVPLVLAALLAYFYDYMLYAAGVADGSADLSPGTGEFWITAAAAVVLALTAIFVLRPLMLGVRRWCCAMAFGNNIGAGAVLYYFRRGRYGRSMRHSGCLLGRILLRLVPVELLALGAATLLAAAFEPAAFSQLFAGVRSTAAQNTLTLWLALVTAMELFGALVTLMLCMRYFLADYLYITEDDADCIAHSVQMMRGWSAAALHTLASFFGWALLSVLAFPLLYLLPYGGVALAVARKWMVYNARHPAESAAPQA